jgi:hypothetical protein
LVVNQQAELGDTILYWLAVSGDTSWDLHRRESCVCVWDLMARINMILVGGLENEFYDFPFSWEWNNHPN